MNNVIEMTCGEVHVPEDLLYDQGNPMRGWFFAFLFTLCFGGALYCAAVLIGIIQ